MPTPPALPRLAGLDGLRALAVILVVVYHLFPGWVVPGGFVGVDVFFVISGFLITTLLLREHAAHGRIRLREFWRRRARRLLPALALVVTVCTSTAWLIGGDLLVGIGRQVLGAATFSFNWLALGGDVGYFSGTTPELFKNLWSLAVEEQFYLLWPLVLPLFLLIPRRWGRAAAAALLAAASAGWMTIVVASGGDLTRAYFGTDTHAFGLLLGVAVAFGMSRLTSPRVPRASDAAPATSPVVVPPTGWTVAQPVTTGSPRRAAVRNALGVAGVIAVLGLIGVAMIPAGEGAATFPGALLAASALTALAIVAAVWPGSWFGRGLDAPVLRWIGDRSYGIYLWHWPLLVLLGAWLAPGAAEVPTGLGILTLVLTVVLAQASYEWLEQPIRQYGFGAALRRLRSGLAASPRHRLTAISGLAAGALVLGGTSAAIAAAPQVSSSEAVVQAGADALAQAERGDAGARQAPAGAAHQRGPSPGPAAPTAGPTTAVEALGIDDEIAEAEREDAAGAEDAQGADGRGSGERGDGAGGPGAGGPGAERPAPTAVAEVPGSDITAVGDSVMLASAAALLDEFRGIDIDADVSRSTYAGPGILRSLADRQKLRDVVVIALGTNGPVSQDALTEMVRIAGPERTLVLVNAHGARDWIPGVNADLARFADRHENVVVADWNRAIAGSPEKLAGDGIHPEPAGGDVFATCVRAAIRDHEVERARLADLSENGRWKDAHRTDWWQRAV